VAEDFAARVRKALVVVAGVIGIAVGRLIVQTLGLGGKKVMEKKKKYVESDGSWVWWWIRACLCCGLCGRRSRRGSFLARVGGSMLASPGSDMDVLVFPTSSIDPDDGGSESRGTSTSVIVTHGENRRRKTSFQVDDV